MELADGASASPRFSSSKSIWSVRYRTKKV